jgi:hypothetical protein
MGLASQESHTKNIMSDDMEQQLVEGLSSILLADDAVEIDDDLIEYIAGMISSKVAEDPTADPQESIEEVLFPFLDSVQCPDDLALKAQRFVTKTLQEAQGVDENGSSNLRKLQQGVVHMASSHQNDADASAWSTNEGAIKARANDIIDAHSEKSSAKQKRRARKVEAETARKLLSNANDQDPDQYGEGLLVSMNVRAFGTVLLESGELKMAYQRRYGLIGENGVGKRYFWLGVNVPLTLRLLKRKINFVEGDRSWGDRWVSRPFACFACQARGAYSSFGFHDCAYCCVKL